MRIFTVFITYIIDRHARFLISVAAIYHIFLFSFIYSFILHAYIIIHIAGISNILLLYCMNYKVHNFGRILFLDLTLTKTILDRCDNYYIYFIAQNVCLHYYLCIDPSRERYNIIILGR